MCGLTGWIDWGTNPLLTGGVLDKMVAALIPRGPDSGGTWAYGCAAFGHRRLAVIDPAGGAQPMVRQIGDHRFVIVYNGELYNSPELKHDLESKGYTFETHCDTEILLVAYIEWGAGCLDRLNGIFAFAVWDEARETLFMARDRLGVKPLFYAARGQAFIFGSEPKALLANPLVKPEVGAVGLSEIFALGPARTPGNGIYKDVYELRPAHCLVYNRGGYWIRRYWNVESKPHLDDLKTTEERVRFLVQDAVKRQLVADVPVCTFLSGGLDSSAVSAVAQAEFKLQGAEKLHTYSVDYIDNERHFTASDFQPNSDGPWISLVSDFISTEHKNILFDTPTLVDSLYDAVKARDYPGMADIDSSLYLFCREVRREATVALSGESADEVFGGYPWFHKEDSLRSNTFPWAKRGYTRTSLLSRELRQYIDPESYLCVRYNETMAGMPRLKGEAPIEARRREIFWLNMIWFLTTLLDRKDRMSMANGLEVRVPFCDHRIVEYVWNIPWSMKMVDNREKGILRRAMAPFLPDAVIARKKSPYPKTHNPSYVSAVKERLREVLNDPSSPLLPLIDTKAVIRIMTTSENEFSQPWFGQLMAAPQLFAYLISIDYWLREYRISVNCTRDMLI